MILAVSTSLEDCLTLAENVRQTIEAHTFSESRTLTCSFGVAEYYGEDIDSFFKRVDVALYKSKDQGRNRVTSVDQNSPIDL